MVEKLFFDASHIFSGARVDLNKDTFIYKRRDLKGVARLHGGRFVVAGSGVAFDPGVRLGDAQVNEDGQGDADAALAMQKDLHFHVVDQEILVVAENFFLRADFDQ